MPFHRQEAGMGILSWLKNLLFPVRRDISGLEAGSEGGLDDVAETVDLNGGPLRDHHYRLALRDARFLPKRRPLLGKRPPVFDRPTARWLFSDTMRTRDRRLRDLTTDEEQLRRYNLPLWRTIEEAAAAIGLSPTEWRHYAIHRDRERICHYVAFTIPKRNGMPRQILAPKKRLKAILRRLRETLVDRLPVSDAVHGFRAHRSVRTNAEPHVGRRVVLKLDVRDFFPSVHVGRVRGLLIALGYGFPVATALAVLMTESLRQPVQDGEEIFFVPVGSRHCVQGAPTSPGLCNAVFRKADHRLAGLARHYGFRYTRYADDLTFSGADPRVARQVQVRAERILAQEGFAVNPAKTRLMRSGGRQTVTGVIVNQTLGLSRQERRRWRAEIHRLTENGGEESCVKRTQVLGRLAWLQMLNPTQAAALRRKLPEEPPGPNPSPQPSPEGRG